MGTFSRFCYYFMITTTLICIIFDLIKGLFDIWKLNTLCWVLISYTFEKKLTNKQDSN
jgi:hypothetical protein